MRLKEQLAPEEGQAFFAMWAEEGMGIIDHVDMPENTLGDAYWGVVGEGSII